MIFSHHRLSKSHESCIATRQQVMFDEFSLLYVQAFFDELAAVIYLIEAGKTSMKVKKMLFNLSLSLIIERKLSSISVKTNFSFHSILRCVRERLTSLGKISTAISTSTCIG